MIGTVSKDVNGVLSINFNLLTAGELSDEHIGDANYYMAEGASMCLLTLALQNLIEMTL